MITPNSFPHLEFVNIYWVGQRVCSGFPITANGKTQMNFLAKPIQALSWTAPYLFLFCLSLPLMAHAQVSLKYSVLFFLRTTPSLHMEYHVPRGSLPLLVCLKNITQSFELSSLPL